MTSGLREAMIACSLIATGCLNDQHGSLSKIYLYPGEKLVSVSWKGTDVWVLAQRRDGGYVYRENSKTAITNGKEIQVEVLRGR